ncbi:hypothetical protein HQ535_06685, partial [bacterium]|nr:hypothetical protein [bacterium]
ARQRLISAEGGSRFDLGDPGAIESFRQVLRVSLEADSSFRVTTAHLNLGEQLRTGWGLLEAIPVHQRGLELAVQRHIGGSEQFLRFALGDDFFSTGEWDEALGQVDAALASPDSFSYLEGGLMGIRLAIHAARDGGGPAFEAEARRIVEESEPLLDLQAVIPAYNAAQWVFLMTGDMERAVEFAGRIVERAGATRFLLDAWSLTVWLLNRAGQLDRIGALLPDLRRYDMPRPRALIASVDALLIGESDGVEALGRLIDAAEALAGLGANVDASLILADAARIADGLDTTKAAEIRSRARGLMTGMRADVLMEILGLV